jgi:hypothetical protein
MIIKSRPFLAALILFAFISLGCALVDRIRSSEAVARLTSGSGQEEATRRRPTPRPTFTLTPAYTATPTHTSTPTITPIPTETPTPVPTDTPLPTDTPTPTETPRPVPPTATFTPGPPTPTPQPVYPFKIKEQGVREFQRTNAPFLVNIILISDANSTPLGGYYVVGEHSSGITYKTPASSWQYDALNGLEGYVKQGNLKFEPPGGFQDGTWTIYMVDGSGNQVSDKIPLSYSSDPSTWVWDFIWWSQ